MRVQLVMPDDLVAQVDEFAKRYGVSRSAYMVMTMSQKVQSEQVMQSMPELQSMMTAMQAKLSAMPVQKDEETKQ